MTAAGPPRGHTMADVAAAAGVSRAAVSRVLLNRGGFSDETRRRVLEAVERLGYVPNVMASQLASRGTNTLGLLLRDAANPAYGLLFTELQTAAHRAGLTLVSMTISADNRGRAQLASLQHLMGMRVAGLIVATGGVSTEQLLPFAGRIPIVRAGRPEPTSAIHAVSYDEERHAHLLAEAVAAEGHRSVAVLITESDYSYPEFVRGTGMARVLRERGVEVRELAVRVPEDGIADAVRLTADGVVTAVMCPSDSRMLGVLRAAAAAGLDVPSDVSVTGCDGILPGLDLLGLTTVRIPVEELAARTIDLMKQLVSDRPPSAAVQQRVCGKLIPGRTLGQPASD